MTRARLLDESAIEYLPKISSNPVNGKVSKAVYKPLDGSRREIRLLSVHPSTEPNDSLSCTLSHADLGPDAGINLPRYEALSYVWGEPDFSEAISLNGYPFFVTPRLERALTSLRQNHKVRNLWVDAICINQLDTEERGQQVALMRHIYSNCERDIAWLDPILTAEPQEEIVFTARSLEKAELRVKEGMELLKSLVHKQGQTLKAAQDSFRTAGDDATRRAHRQLAALFKGPSLWKRLWVMPELSLAPQVTLKCGKAELEWQSLAAFFKDEPYLGAFHMDYPSHSRSYYRGFSEIFLPAKRIEDQRQLLSQDGKKTSSLLEVLTRFRAMESTDSRDTIFGLLGLVNDNHDIKVDYTQSFIDVYKTATLSLINQSGNLDILCQSPFELWGGPRALELPRKDSIPTWAGQFDAKPEDCVPVLFAQRRIFAAGTKYCATPCRAQGPQKDILVLRGVMLGSIGPILQKRVSISQRLDKKERNESHLKRGPSNQFIRSQDREAGYLMEMYLGKEAIRNPDSRFYEPKVGDGMEQPLSPENTVSTANADGRPGSIRETAFCAFLRTIFRDCTQPPRVRRLHEAEILSLQLHNRDATNQGFIRGLKNYKVRDEWRVSRYAFSYDPKAIGEGESDVKLTYVGYAPYNRDLMFTMTDNGLFLLVRPHVQKGDIVVILDGAKVPMVLRKTELHLDCRDTNEAYQIVCSAYAHGFMDGEVEIEIKEGRLTKQDIALI
ncbi:uncharacterized protein FIESC28_01118 [Fusarium coffeatum]|uniref:Heterokaryon incompatibility domain-containing protein n=1 Tax=Fusarium coffeatum TaxID=231269 RepID=A0A366SBJ3_9HYPO|nr:uncharacterized protein FIESC28_01118 [Fusarium coffeatum]RBR26090.1 hypothetical protein FIESC28_01118 [Fusarium coffeatum]